MQDRHNLYGTAEYWDEQAAWFDDEPDHGLTTDRIRAAWSRRLAAWLPEDPSTVVDLGCGTGSLSVLAAEAGHDTLGVDLSPAMVERAQLKALPLDLPVRFVVGDAADPGLTSGTFDVVLVRHVTWAMPDTGAALRRWASLLEPDGRLIAIEGRWGSGGITATALTAGLTPSSTTSNTTTYRATQIYGERRSTTNGMRLSQRDRDEKEVASNRDTRHETQRLNTKT